MGKLADYFERLIEKFLAGDLDRRTRILSWATLAILGVCLWGSIVLSDYRVPIKDRQSGQETRIQIMELLLHKNR